MSPPSSEGIPKSMRFGLIAASSACSESVTFPIDFTKTRMQLHVGKAGFIEVLLKSAREEGISAIYGGVQPAILRHWVYTSLRISIYEDLRNWMGGGTGQTTALQKAGCGLFAGGVAQCFASPADRLKVVMVQEGGKRSMLEVGKSIVKTEGFLGMYKGWIPNVQRAALVNLGELATYDQAKRFVLQSTGLPDGVMVHTMSAVCSGLVASFCATPADVVKSRVMGGQATGVVSCVRDTVRNEGAGFFPNWGRLGPWQFVFWVSYEQFRHICGYGGF